MRGDEPGVYIMSDLYQIETSSAMAPRSHLENQTLKFVRQVNIGCRWALGFIHVRIGKCEVEGNDKPGIRFDSGVATGSWERYHRFTIYPLFLQRQTNISQERLCSQNLQPEAGQQDCSPHKYCYTSCPSFCFLPIPT